MDLTKALAKLVQDHIEEQKNDPQMLTLTETIALLGGSRSGNVHDGMWPEDVAQTILLDLIDLGMLEQAKEYFAKLDEAELLEETSLYGIMVDLGAVEWE